MNEVHIYSHQINFRKKISKDIEIQCIFPKAVISKHYNYSSFEDFFGIPEIYIETTDIIDSKYMGMMEKCSKFGQVYM